ncbi:hypothetical protein [uncultured Microbulbifer sp.]|uniref:hypothetical protein n=1 Tax=uncultured Microbulbifer sp. TaxID=348147 RepID=UPI002632A62E|nr:hypothetical protein [uncultured Microbulbifer sp.]
MKKMQPESKTASDLRVYWLDYLLMLAEPQSLQTEDSAAGVAATIRNRKLLRLTDKLAKALPEQVSEANMHGELRKLSRALAEIILGQRDTLEECLPGSVFDRLSSADFVTGDTGLGAAMLTNWLGDHPLRKVVEFSDEQLVEVDRGDPIWTQFYRPAMDFLKAPFNCSECAWCGAVMRTGIRRRVTCSTTCRQRLYEEKNHGKDEIKKTGS